MRIRLHGTPAQIEQLLGRLGSIVDIAEISRPYRDRAPSKLSRVYVRVDLDPARQSTVEPATS